DPQWMPIRYENRNLGRQTLAGFHAAARMALVTPLRDGMNLVAKEFVAAQDAHDPGVLLLSRFAGATEQLSGAVLVNAYGTGGAADTIGTGMRMPPDERWERHSRLLRSLQQLDVLWWTTSFLVGLDHRVSAQAAEAFADDAADA